MPNYSQGVSDRVSTNRKRLESSMSNIKKGVLGLCALTLISCTAAGKQFITDTFVGGIQTGVGTWVYNSVNDSMYGQSNQGTQTNPDRHLSFFNGRWIYTEEGTSYRTKLENGKFFRMKSGNWVPVPNGIPIFH